MNQSTLSYLQSHIRKEKNTLCDKDVKTTDVKTTDVKKPITCAIDDIKIYNISYFLSAILTNCNNYNITLDNIRYGKIIGKGEFGYSFKIKNSQNNIYVVKIIICDKNNENLLNDEIEINKEICISKNDCFIKMLSYYEFDKKNNNYSYYNYNNKNSFNKLTCNIKLKTFTSNICEKYLLIEGGEMDMFTYSLL